MRLFSFISFWRPDKGSRGSDQHLMWHCFSAHGQWFLRFSVPFLLQLYPDPACSSGLGLTMFLRLPDVFLLALSAVQPYSRMAKTFYMIPQLVTPWKKQFSVLSSLIATNCAIPPRRPKPFYVSFRVLPRIKKVPEIFFKNVLHSQDDVKIQGK